MKTNLTIECELSVNEPEGHGIRYKNNLENNIAGLMIGAQVLETNLASLKSVKKEASGAEKKAISYQISKVSKVIQGINELTMQVLDSYELLKASADLAEKKEAITGIKEEN